MITVWIPSAQDRCWIEGKRYEHSEKFKYWSFSSLDTEEKSIFEFFTFELIGEREEKAEFKISKDWGLYLKTCKTDASLDWIPEKQTDWINRFPWEEKKNWSRADWVK